MPQSSAEKSERKTGLKDKIKNFKRIKWFAKRGPLDVTFLTLVLLLMAFGLVMLFSASYANARYNYGDSFHFIKDQIVFAVVGVVGMLVISFIDYRVLNRYAFAVYLLAIVLLIIALILPPVKGDFHRWINLRYFGLRGTFQPSEIAKFAIVLLYARLIAAYGEKMKTFKYGVVPFLITFGIIAVLMLLEPHVSGTVLIFTLAAIMMFVGGTRFRWFGLAAAAAAVAVGIFLIMPGGLSYARERIDIWLDPYVDPQGDGFQTIQSLIAIGSGGIMGKGLGDSRQKYLYIPEPQNDFIFAVVCEELGFVGATIIIILFALLVWRGFIIAMRAKDKFGSMLAVGLTMQVGIQTLLNIAVVTNTVPNTGISLPFFSYGGTALLMLLFQMGVVLSISREARIDK
ncbi:MAG: putative lipid II flippase FtsW [Oscillospiraceae bacterium]|nr:putative lipid II flippase FtsW [Oscillospiraceae bacterium]MBQ9938068.1 putative lipid II flippase FtsW [Oscillospiraceae bacterium]